MILIIGLLVAIFLGLFAIFFPVYYISELILSFLPYMLVFGFIGFVTSIVLLRNKKMGKYIQIIPLFVLLFGLLFFLTSRQYNHFYTGEGFENQNMIETGIDILYSNILYTNDDYEGLQKMIQERDPDMVLMVEFTDDHNDNLQKILKKDYPYSARTINSNKDLGGAVFSKIPIVDLTDAVDQGAWRYTYFNIKYNEANYYIYLVHTSSPINYHYFEMRNKQFDILSKDFAVHQLDRKDNDKVLMLGDFNVSPWSKYYKDFAMSLTGLDNLTNRFITMFTWNLSFLPFIKSHIDHIFASQNIIVGDIDEVNTPGSDHRGFYMQNVR